MSATKFAVVAFVFFVATSSFAAEAPDCERYRLYGLLPGMTSLMSGAADPFPRNTASGARGPASESATSSREARSRYSSRSREISPGNCSARSRENIVGSVRTRPSLLFPTFSRKPFAPGA